MAIKEELLALAQKLESGAWGLNSRWLGIKAEELQGIADRMEDGD